MPSLASREALLVLLQGGLLVSRTLLTDHISRIEGVCGRAITSLVGGHCSARRRAAAAAVCCSRLPRQLRAAAAGAAVAPPAGDVAAPLSPVLPSVPPPSPQQFTAFGNAVVAFAVVGIPAAVVNAALKYGQKQIELSFQQRLGLTLHRAYTHNRAYYAASTLGGLTHADQRITEDVERFAASCADVRRGLID